MPTGKKATATTIMTEDGPKEVHFAVGEGETPWTQEEIDEVRDELEGDRERFRVLVERADAELLSLLADGNDGAGRDPADVGSSNFERDQEILITAKNREQLEQCERALEAMVRGDYGTCESCGNPIGKTRLQVFPRATLCVTCKQREERR